MELYLQPFLCLHAMLLNSTQDFYLLPLQPLQIIVETLHPTTGI
jgi:hypothetical protein